MNAKGLFTEIQKVFDDAYEEIRLKHRGVSLRQDDAGFPNELVLKLAKVNTLSRVLRRAGDDLKLAVDESERTLASLQERQVLTIERPRPTLPAEILQHIIKLAYDNETLQFESLCNVFWGRMEDDYRVPDTSGARSLASTIHRSNGLLLSTTVVYIDNYIRFTDALDLDKVPRSKFRAAFLPDSSENISVLQVVNQYPRRIISLAVCSGDQMKACAASIPYLREFSFHLDDKKSSEPDWAWLRRAVAKCPRERLRSATIPSCLLPKFVASKFFESVTSLVVYHSVELSKKHSWPRIQHVFASIGKCKMLTALELRGSEFFRCHRRAATGSDSPDCETDTAVPSELARLRKLQLSGENWDDLCLLLWQFPSCNLTELGFTNYERRIFNGDLAWFCQRRSESFPNLRILHIATTEIRKVLCQDHTDADQSTIWNFPKLHTLDIRGIYCGVVKELADIVQVLRERAASKPSCPDEQAITPINCFWMDSFDLQYEEPETEDEDEGEERSYSSDDDEDRNQEDGEKLDKSDSNIPCDDGTIVERRHAAIEKTERLLYRLEIEKIVPNFMWNTNKYYRY